MSRGDREYGVAKWRHLLGVKDSAPLLRNFFFPPPRSCAPPPWRRCLICAILFAHFVDWALACCTRANQRETGQRRYGKGDRIEGIGSCQHGLVCYGPTKLLTLLYAKKSNGSLISTAASEAGQTKRYM